ncbi:MAG: hypothetical protein HY584_01225 [Candidatus Omnitrophica bacterium]|nr:hypothetical protein [Candidatus Omnitrophota bacterium]
MEVFVKELCRLIEIYPGHILKTIFFNRNEFLLSVNLLSGLFFPNCRNEKMIVLDFIEHPKVALGSASEWHAPKREQRSLLLDSLSTCSNQITNDCPELIFMIAREHFKFIETCFRKLNLTGRNFKFRRLDENKLMNLRLILNHTQIEQKR